MQSNLKSVFDVVIPGAHLVRDPVMPKASTDQELRDMGWFEGKAHPVTGAALEMVALDLPPGTAHKPGECFRRAARFLTVHRSVQAPSCAG